VEACDWEFSALLVPSAVTEHHTPAHRTLASADDEDPGVEGAGGVAERQSVHVHPHTRGNARPHRHLGGVLSPGPWSRGGGVKGGGVGGKFVARCPFRRLCDPVVRRTQWHKCTSGWAAC